MRKALFSSRDEYLFFGEENRLKVFQPYTFNFKPKIHIKLDEALMTYKCRGSIVVLSISKSVEPNEEQKEM